MAHPESAHFLLRGGEGEVVLHHGMAEEGGVEVDAQTVFTGELDPRIEVMGLDLVAVHLLAGGEDGVAGVQADALFAGHEAHGLDKVRLQFLEGAGAAGVVARGLDAAGKGAAAAFKADDVVALPAVDADGHVLQGGEGCFHIHAPRLVALLRALVALAHDDLILSAFRCCVCRAPWTPGSGRAAGAVFFLPLHFFLIIQQNAEKSKDVFLQKCVLTFYLCRPREAGSARRVRGGSPGE